MTPDPQTRQLRAFSYTSQPQRVLFGAGSLGRLADELDALGARKALVLCTHNQRPMAQQAANALGDRVAGLFAGAAMHVPLATAQEARALAAQLGADCAVAIGGGSTIGLGKALALDPGMPVIAVPTTYAGSEMTPIYGITDRGRKKTGKDPRVLPRTVIYDPELSLGLPLDISITSGINAMAHAAEGLYAADGNPLMDVMAREGIAALARALPLLRADAADLDARSDALYGAWLCGSVLGNVGMALHHKLCHTLLYTASGTATINPFVYRKLAYNARDLVPVTRMLSIPLVISVPVQSPYRTVADLIKDAKARPGAVSYASYGVGTVPHMSMAYFANSAGITLNHVPYRDGGLTDVLGGRVDTAFSPIADVLPYIRAGKIRPLAVSSAQRLESLPQVPTVAELFPAFEGDSWHGVFAVKGTPQPVVEQLARLSRRIAESDDYRKYLAEFGLVPVGGSAEDFSGIVDAESKRWSMVVKNNNISLE